MQSTIIRQIASQTQSEQNSQEKTGIVNSLNSNTRNPRIQKQMHQDQGTHAFHKKTENKAKYRRLRHKLNALCSQSLQNRYGDHGPPFSHKCAILKLCGQFHNRVGQHSKDYHLIEQKLKQILKALSKKREDIAMIKNSDFVGGFSVLLKEASTFNKTDFIRSEKSLQLGMKILRICCMLSSNCQYLISTNQLILLNTCLITLYAQSNHKLTVLCLEVLHSLLSSAVTSNSKDSGQIGLIVGLSIQIVLMGQLLDRVKRAVQQSVNDQNNEELIIKSLKYVSLVEEIHFQNQLARQIYQQEPLSHLGEAHSETMIGFIYALLPRVLLDEDKDLKFEYLPVCVIDITLYCLKILQNNVHLNVGLAQQVISMQKSDRFTICIKKLLYHVEQQIEEGEYIHEEKKICSAIIRIIGKIAYNNEPIKKNIRESGVLSLLFNHPLIYLMDENLKNILIPAICSTIDCSRQNLQLYLSENSSDCLVAYISDCIHNYKHQKSEDIVEYPNQNKSKYANQLKSVLKDAQQNIKRKRVFGETLSSLNKGTSPINRYCWLLEVLPLDRWPLLMDSLINMDK